MSLDEYNKKRNFNATSEPKGIKKKTNKDKIFAVQYHSATRNHFDFRLEHNGALLSWAIPKGFSYNPKIKHLAVQVEDHPIDYADFEGIIPKGEYGAGPVMLWDKGTFLANSSISKGLKNGILKFELFGERLQGKWSLVKLKTDNTSWLIIKEKDNYCNTFLTLPMTSIKTGRTIDEIRRLKASNPFSTTGVQLATLTKDIPDSKDWLFEIKYDGYRMLTYAENGKVKLVSRNNNEYSNKFTDVKNNLSTISQNKSFVLDGEIVKIDSYGKSNFQELQNSIKSNNQENIVYMVFDILALDGEDLRGLPLLERKEILNKFFKNLKNKDVFNINCVDFVIGNGKKCFSIAKEQNLEGIIAKRIDSKYIGKRTDDWLKIKCVNLQEFIIIGYTKSSKKEHFSSLLLATREDNELVFIGKVGTGFDEESSHELMVKFKEIETEDSPIVDTPKIKAKIQWLRPKLIANIQYAEITKAGLLRQASFKGLRDDKNINEIKLEKVKNITKKSSKNNDFNFKITNPNKIVFKEKNIRKIDIINYYKAVANHMLKYMSNRILSVVRCHGGVGANCFYKKHPKSNPYVKKIKVDNHEYFYIDNVDALLYEVQLGSIEFHAWGSKIDNIDKPNIMVFDLDPDEDLSLEAIRQGVRDLHSILQSLKLKAYLKTSGGKGYHIVVPMNADFNWEEFSDFAEKVATIMQSKWPDKYTTNIRKNQRVGKIFIDHLRNSKSATSVCPYSLRVRDGATVSMPISWSELDKIAPNGIDIFEAMKRLKKRNPWGDFKI